MILEDSHCGRVLS